MAQLRGEYDGDPGPRYERACREAHKLLKKAADAWAGGDPEDPPTEEVLQEILDLFIRRRLLRLPFGGGPA
jgi:hypothetical protein